MKESQRNDQPPKQWIVALAAMTLDGKIAQNHHHFTDWTSKEDKAFFQRKLHSFEVFLVGNNTYKTAQKQLSQRNCMVFTKRVQKLTRIHERLVYCNPSKTNLRHYLQKQGYRKIGVLGGRKVYSYCLQHGLLDQFFITLEPLIFGEGLALFDHPFHMQKLRLVKCKRLNAQGTLLLEYEVV
ncbi:dihydrofolate reductase [Candidatus Woesearchaeota archaeon]|nr:dihydrofolate reductase [Candidatus Woesearchaeota archaeon]